jgi:hypothetical protein
MEVIFYFLIGIGIFAIGSIIMKKRKDKAKDSIFNTLNQNDLTIQELIFYGCKYVDP